MSTNDDLIRRLGARTQTALLDIPDEAFAGQPWNQMHTAYCKSRGGSSCIDIGGWQPNGVKCPAGLNRNAPSLKDRLFQAIAEDREEALAASAAREAALTEWVIHLMERVAELQMANNLMSSANPPTQQEPAR